MSIDRSVQSHHNYTVLYCAILIIKLNTRTIESYDYCDINFLIYGH